MRDRSAAGRAGPPTASPSRAAGSPARPSRTASGRAACCPAASRSGDPATALAAVPFHAAPAGSDASGAVLAAAAGAGGGVWLKSSSKSDCISTGSTGTASNQPESDPMCEAARDGSNASTVGGNPSSNATGRRRRRRAADAAAAAAMSRPR